MKIVYDDFFDKYFVKGKGWFNTKEEAEQVLADLRTARPWSIRLNQEDSMKIMKIAGEHDIAVTEAFRYVVRKVYEEEFNGKREETAGA